MIYTDGIHLVADSLQELHSFAVSIGLSRKYFHGIRRGHPHYDITSKLTLSKVFDSENVEFISSKEILEISKKMK